MASKKSEPKKSGVSVGKVAAISAGVAALGAGAYYLLGPDAKKNQKKVGAWMDAAEKEISSVVKKAQKVSEPIYHNLVDGLVSKYASQYNMKEKEMATFAKKLKSEWKGTKTAVTKKAAAAVKAVAKAKKVVAKAEKKAIKKVVSASKQISTAKKSTPKKK